MQYSVRILLVCALITSLAGACFAHNPSVVLTGSGTALVDGVMTPGEWDHAGHTQFLVNVPAAEGGGTALAELYVMNDATRIYMLIRFAHQSASATAAIRFDNNNDGVASEGDNSILATWGTWSPLEAIDQFMTGCFGDIALGACPVKDTDAGGSNDLVAATSGGEWSTVEMSFPLSSTDAAHDFQVRPGQVLGFTTSIHLVGAGCSDDLWFNCIADTGFPAPESNVSLYGDIVLQVPATPVAVSVGAGAAAINLRSMETVPVVVLSSPEVNPATIDVSTVRFGRTGTEVGASDCALTSDHNRDGIADLTCRFRVSTAGFVLGDNQAVLSAFTTGGARLVGEDDIRLVGHAVPPGCSK